MEPRGAGTARIARVYRMGQSRPVRVINFVTRNTIEERVLRGSIPKWHYLRASSMAKAMK